MNKIAIIGLGLVGNSIGMGLKKSWGDARALQIVGFDPDRLLEEAALRKHASVTSIAPDLESAVRGANLVIISTPATAAREVLVAIAPFLDTGAAVTDTLSCKGQIMAWADELLGENASFVGGHPLSRSIDIETATELDTPSADLFVKAPYCIIPSPRASNEALNTVIGMAEALRAQPLFIDPAEHDSFFAAVSHLPVVASAALLHITAGSPSWADIGSLASGQFRTMVEPVSTEPATLLQSLVGNRSALLHWIDQYLLALQDMRDLLAHSENQALLLTLKNAHEAREQWANPQNAAMQGSTFSAHGSEQGEQLRAEFQQAVQDARPSSQLLGSYLTNRIFRKKDK